MWGFESMYLSSVWRCEQQISLQSFQVEIAYFKKNAQQESFPKTKINDKVKDQSSIGT